MIVVALLCHVAPASLIGVFPRIRTSLRSAPSYLQVISWSFIFSGFIFTCSGMFQAMGNTWPALWSGVARPLIWAIPAVWMSRQADFELHNLWVLAVVTMAVQAVLSFWLIRSQMNKRLAAFATPPKTAA